MSRQIRRQSSVGCASNTAWSWRRRNVAPIEILGALLSNRIICPEVGDPGASGAIPRRQRQEGILNYYHRDAD